MCTLTAASAGFWAIASTSNGLQIPMLQVIVPCHRHDEFAFVVPNAPDPLTLGRRKAFRLACRLLKVCEESSSSSALAVGGTESEALTEIFRECLHEDDPAKAAVLAAGAAIFFNIEDCPERRNEAEHLLVVIHELGHWLVALSGWIPGNTRQNEEAAWQAGEIVLPCFPQASFNSYQSVRRASGHAVNILPESQITAIRQLLPVYVQAGS